MVVYLLQQTKYAQTRDDILSGKGARRFGGRWNPVGAALVYSSATPELAHSELMIHLKNIPPPTCNFIMIQVPDESITKLSHESLSQGWRSYQNYRITQKTTENWLKDKSSLVLQVPSAIVPMSYNFLINPLHIEIEKVNIIRSEPFIFDERYNVQPKSDFMAALFDKMQGE